MRWLFRPFETWLSPFAPGPDCPLPTEAFRFIGFFLAQARWPFIVILIASGLTGLIEAGLYASVGIIIDALGTTDKATVWSDYGLMFIAMAFTVLVLRTVAMSVQTLIGEQTVVPLVFAMVRWQLHRRVLRQSYAYFQDDFAGRIATKVMQAGPSIGDFLTNLIQGIWQFIIFGVLAIGLFTSLDWRLALLLITWFAAYFYTLYATIGEIRQRAKVQSQARATVNGRLVDSYTNIQTVKLFAGTDREDAFVREAIEDQMDKVMALGRYVTGLRITLNVLSGLLITLTAALGIWLWQVDVITLGALAATLGLVLRLNHMSGWISFQINGLFRELGTIQDTIETVAAEASVADAPTAVALRRSRGPIQFERVSFRYGRGAAALHDITLTIPPGQKVGLVGRSGAGKTTLTSVLLRLYDINGGAIRIGQQDISDVTQESLRRAIGVVTQDTSLLHRSVYDNILYGRPDATRAEVIAAARKARAHEFIEDLADVRGRTGYDAHVGERGADPRGLEFGEEEPDRLE
ncbi:MAG: ABC transporter ATP-binding protein, partial [Pseudomonadota bacterium]